MRSVEDKSGVKIGSPMTANLRNSLECATLLHRLDIELELFHRRNCTHLFNFRLPSSALTHLNYSLHRKMTVFYVRLI